MLALFTFLCLTLFGPPVLAEVQVPKNEGWVTDLADILKPAEEAQLEALMESYKQGTTHEIALLTVPDLAGESIERFGLEVGRQWGIGGEQQNGALILISTGDRKMRIEAGRGLEGNLTDLACGRIIRDVMRPEFKRGRMFEGVRQGVMATHSAIGGDYGPIKRSRGGQRSSRRRGGGLMFFVLLGFFFLVGRGANRGGRGGGGGLGSMLPWLIMGSMANRGGGSFGSSSSSGGSFGGGGGGFSGFGGGGGFSGGGASGGW